MFSHRPRRIRAPRIGAPTRGLVPAAVLALVLTGCGESDRATPEQEPGPSSSQGPTSTPAGDVAAPDPGFGAPPVGACYRMTATQSRASVATGRRVGCKKPHTSVVAHVGFLRAAMTARTPLARRRALGQRLCAPAYRRLAGGTLADRATSVLTWTLFTPSRSQLQRGARWVRCDVFARSGEELVPLPATRPLLSEGVPEPLRVCQDGSGADVSCARQHAFRVAAVFRAAGEDYPDPDRYTTVARDRCRELTGEAGGWWQPPSRGGWQGGDRFVRCLTRAG